MVPVTWFSASLGQQSCPFPGSASRAAAGAQARFLLENSSTSLCCWDAVSHGNVDGDRS